MLARPTDGGICQGIEDIARIRQARLFVVVSLNHWAAEFADDLHAFVGIGVVADHVADADVMRAAAIPRVGQNGLQRF